VSHFIKFCQKNNRALFQVTQIYYTVVGCPIIQIWGFTIGAVCFVGALNSIKYTYFQIIGYFFRSRCWRCSKQNGHKQTVYRLF
jgi:hypothetical protein